MALAGRVGGQGNLFDMGINSRRRPRCGWARAREAEQGVSANRPELFGFPFLFPGNLNSAPESYFLSNRSRLVTQLNVSLRSWSESTMERSARRDVREPVRRCARIEAHRRDAREFSNPAHLAEGTRSTCARRDTRRRESGRQKRITCR